MSVEEMLQLLLDKLVIMEGEMKAMRSDINELKQGQNRLEAKIDANHAEAMSEIKELKADVAEIKEDIQYLKRQDDVDTQSINGCYNAIKEVNGKLDRVIADQGLHRRSTQANIAELQAHQETLEDDIKDIKARLDKAS